MKRLLCIISSMNAGGAESFLMKLYRSLDRKQYQMDFCINSFDACFYESEIMTLGGRIYRIPDKTTHFFRFINDLYHIINNGRYEYVLRITSNSMGFLDLAIAKIAGAQKCSARSSNSSDGNSIAIKIMNLFGRILFLNCVNIRIAPSRLAGGYPFGKRLVRAGKVFDLHNGLDTELFHFDKSLRESARMEFSADNNTLIVGHIGRFDYQKNHTKLIQVFYEIQRIEHNSLLLLVGNGNDMNKIKQLVSELGLDDKVVFAGVRDDVPRLLMSMDVMVFPSFYEGMPNTIIEAQTTGLPCLVSNTVTKEARVTNIVSFMDLKESSKKWAIKAISISNNKVNRFCYYKAMRKKGYDINDCAKRFVELVF